MLAEGVSVKTMAVKAMPPSERTAARAMVTEVMMSETTMREMMVRHPTAETVRAGAESPVVAVKVWSDGVMLANCPGTPVLAPMRTMPVAVPGMTEMGTVSPAMMRMSMPREVVWPMPMSTPVRVMPMRTARVVTEAVARAAPATLAFPRVL